MKSEELAFSYLRHLRKVVGDDLRTFSRQFGVELFTIAYRFYSSHTTGFLSNDAL